MQAPPLLVDASALQRFYGRHAAVKEVSLQLKQGEVLGLLGPNGAGKSTILQMLTGTLAAHAGDILINGINLREYPQQAKQHIGYLPEQPPLHRDMTPQEYLSYCGQLHGLHGTALRNAVSWAMDCCDLGSVTRRLIGNLSKGFQQRVGIAQAILHKPAVIILDEPSVGLDPLQLEHIRQVIKELSKAHGIILSTHILQEVEAICQRVQVIHQGQTVLNETLDSLAHQQQTLAHFFNQQLSKSE